MVIRGLICRLAPEQQSNGVRACLEHVPDKPHPIGDLLQPNRPEVGRPRPLQKKGGNCKAFGECQSDRMEEGAAYFEGTMKALRLDRNP